MMKLSQSKESKNLKGFIRFFCLLTLLLSSSLLPSFIYSQQYADDLQFDEMSLKYNDQNNNEDYRLKIGDSLLVSIFGESDTKRELVVDLRGMISYLFIDSMPASGKTIKELREELIEQLRKYYRRAILSITPLRFNTEYYSIVGQVNKPGRQPLIGNPTVLSAICKAEGFVTLHYRNQIYDLCDLDKAFISRKGKYLPIDFHRLVRDGDQSQDVILEPGDYIYIANRGIKQVYILGEVKAPIAVEYMNSMSLVEALAEAGDFTLRASSRVVVLRGSLASPLRYLVDLDHIVKGRGKDFALQPGDIIYVPPRKLYFIKELALAAVNSFVSTVASYGGTEFFLKLHPHAKAEFSNRQLIIGGGQSTSSGTPTP